MKKSASKEVQHEEEPAHHDEPAHHEGEKAEHKEEERPKSVVKEDKMDEEHHHKEPASKVKHDTIVPEVHHQVSEESHIAAPGDDVDRKLSQMSIEERRDHLQKMPTIHSTGSAEDGKEDHKTSTHVQFPNPTDWAHEPKTTDEMEPTPSKKIKSDDANKTADEFVTAGDETGSNANISSFFN